MTWTAADPLDEPVSLEAPLHLERNIKLRKSGRYFLYLVFDRRDASFEQLRSLVGGVYGQKIEVNGSLVDAGEPSGLAIPIVWSLRTQRGAVVAGERSEVLGGHAFSKAEIARLLYKGDLVQGDYAFTAALTQGIAAFRGIRARLRLEPQRK